MFRRAFGFAFGMVLSFVLVACKSQPTQPSQPTPAPSPPTLQAPLFDDLGNYSSTISTQVPTAQRFFDQGLILAYGFNHAEAARSFREAARLDPQCAMCYWGIAWVLGPNINMPMMDDAAPEAYSAAQKALALGNTATPREQALILAVTRRYAPEPPTDRVPLDIAFASAMRTAAQQYPNDLEVQTIFAESLMDLSPWNYWTESGQPKTETVEIIAALETVMAANPQHPGANHLYIHAVEASPDPRRAEPAADRLGPLAPGAGHLVHMPSHIYIRIGRYNDAAVANIKAGEADMSYIAQCQAQGVYPLLYHPHNWHFLWASATFAGNSSWARRGALQTRELMGTHQHDDPMFGPYIQHFWLVPIHDDVRFGRWDEILSMPEPENLPYPRAVWHYGRGMALVATANLPAAEKELEIVSTYAKDPALASELISVRNNAAQVVEIARQVLAGQIEAHRKNYDAAIAALTKGVALEDGLGYNEPEDWNYPVRLFLGAVQLEAGRPNDAEKTFGAELSRHPDNGWALFGLEKSLAAQNRSAEASAAHERFVAAWSTADVTLTTPIIR